ncbi:MAG: DUF3035 domain-containing protein [Rhodospirillaceae bacterium]|nr:DUF3035 domain-containing protein [Rhodospirillaceae bacterium]MBT5513403.1 DUF3035 domain-containing protein [Rhodospirillaceae bacterium]MBT6087897.1 DUF3035 domain-containing protein [Rhodospirillaceae bacterium]MBT6610169.1 DUF3035 domain-containing protein [Rhodospirillaceae bacterium]MBT6885230.1 DUF3035 domain-containing protein [Rhodospirillaceae bacterium]
MIKQVGLCLCIAAFSAAVAGCESAKKAFGGGKRAPDEFVVYKRPPLSLPPSFGLRPPDANAQPPALTNTTNVAKSAMLGRQPASALNRTPPAPSSPGLQTLLKNTGANTAEPGIRKTINQESSVLAEEDQLFVNKLIFWVDDKSAKGTVVDPKKERQRIMQNEALGKPINEGETPQIVRKKERKGLLDF